jgi:hypothetical protein
MHNSVKAARIRIQTVVFELVLGAPRVTEEKLRILRSFGRCGNSLGRNRSD